MICLTESYLIKVVRDTSADGREASGYSLHTIKCLALTATCPSIMNDFIGRRDFGTAFYWNPLPRWVYDLETHKILDVNQAALDLYGYTRDEFLSITIKDLWPKNEVPESLVAHENFDKTEGNIHFGTFANIKKNGETIRMSINGHRVDFMEKKCVMVIGQAVTEQKIQFKLNKEAEHIMNASLDVVCLIDQDGRFVHVSAGSKSLRGYEPKELEGQTYMNLVHEEDKAKTNQIIADIRGGGRFTKFENRSIKKNGSIVSNLWSVSWDAGSKTLYAIARDADEKREPNELLIESEGRFKALMQEGYEMIAILDFQGNYK